MKIINKNNQSSDWVDVLEKTYNKIKEKNKAYE